MRPTDAFIHRCSEVFLPAIFMRWQNILSISRSRRNFTNTLLRMGTMAIRSALNLLRRLQNLGVLAGCKSLLSKGLSWGSSRLLLGRARRSRSGPSPVTARYASRARCPRTGGCSAATLMKNGPVSRVVTGNARASQTKISLKLAPAADTLKALPASHTFDFGFIDADKSNYMILLRGILKRMRPNGVIIIDNVLWNGAIVDESVKDADTLALRAINDFVAKDSRVEAVMLAVADGLTIVRKK